MTKLDTIKSREQRTGLILILPALILLLFVYGYPIARALWLSLFTQNLGTKLKPVFSGLDNYIRMAGGGPGGATEVVSLYIYATVMRYLDFGYGSALVVVTFLLLILAVAQ